LPGGKEFKWAVAGRSELKVKEFVQTVKIVEGVSRPEIIVADVEDQKSIDDMVGKTRLLIDGVGPFRFLGPQVVKSCIDQGTHYVDICGETDFIERMYHLHHTSAQEKRVTVVSACGMDSVPADWGVEVCKREMHKDGVLPSSVEMYHYSIVGPAGYAVNYATYESLVNSFAHVDELRKLRKSVCGNPCYSHNAQLLRSLTTWY